MNYTQRGCWIAQHGLLFFVCIFFSSCTKKQVKKYDYKKLDDVKKSADADLIKRQEAMLVDIPLPLYDEAILDDSYIDTESDTVVLGYKSPLSCLEAIDFFMHQMERYGWQNIVYFGGPQALLQFESPDRYCTISITKQESSGSYIFIYTKRASTNARP